MRLKKLKWERKAEERPGALLHAALDVFCRQGYRATRLEVVADAAGVSKGTVYRYFRNKEDLLKQALEERVRIKLGATEAALQEFSGAPAEKLRFILTGYWTRAQEADFMRFHRLMFGEIARELPLLFQYWIQNGTVRGWKLLEGIIREGQESGAFRKNADAQGVAQFALSGLFHQAYLQAHIGTKNRSACPPDRILQSVLDLLITGLKPIKLAGKKHD
ncbi:MAG: TetR family transcriptional regulator [Fibrobacteres bacterium]|nr:TetR family transcriptional regulator [Fibrobacterota bacterium]